MIFMAEESVEKICHSTGRLSREFVEFPSPANPEKTKVRSKWARANEVPYSADGFTGP